MQYIYGPVHSRRLGRSLGVNLTPERCCSLDCIYCEEAQPTQSLGVERCEYAPVHQVIEEIREAASADLDYITFSGAGEPTLHSGLGTILAACRDLEPPTAVLTNSTLLHLPKVRRELQLADLVVPSLDAVSERVFQRINRPAPGVTAEQVKRGLRLFCQEYQGAIWLEVLFVSGVNDHRQEAEAIARFANGLPISKIHLNTISRATTVAGCRPVEKKKLETIAQLFEKPVEIYT